MAYSKTLFLFFFFCTVTSIFSSLSSAQQQFRCTSRPTATCNALIDYVSPNTTTISAVKNLFTVKNLRTILGANNLPADTPANFTIAANQTIRIPFPCACRNGFGLSRGMPNYTIVPGDGLYHIAAEVFGGLVTFQQIQAQAVNNISDPNIIEAGQTLYIPLPCSCDDVDGQQVVHYGHEVAPGSSVEGIAQQYNTSGDTLMRLNNLTSAQDLLAGAILDVPLRACSSMVSNTSRDYPLLVANGTYVYTANNCVRCTCDAAMNWMLQCEPFQFNASCPPVTCPGGGNLSLGNTTTSGCNSTTCAYAGYSTQIMTTVAVESTCPVSDNGSSVITLRLWGWSFLIIVIHSMFGGRFST